MPAHRHPVPSRRSATLVAAIATLGLVLAACTSAPAGPQSPSPRAGSPSASPTAEPPAGATAEPPPTGVTGSITGATGAPARTSVEIAPPRGGSFLLEGRYPRVRSRCVRKPSGTITGRYPGTLTVERADDGTFSVTLAIAFREYLKGIAEVPPSWPMAALQAQAIAARSYALASTGWKGNEGAALEQTICATTSCQVYRGIPLTHSPDIRRWYRAVRTTDGEVLLYDGAPATTFYFSTSNGRTYGNEDVFGGTPLPYLRSVPEHDDGASSLSHWTTTVRFDDLARFLDAAGEWPRSDAISSVRLEGGSVLVAGPGRSASMSLSTFRDAVNSWASCLEPGRYPQHGMPTTIPSRWLSMASGDGAVTIRGRGWGHGVGMVQWGAYGKARRGMSAADILASYYGGLRPERYPEPGLIDVEIAQGLRSLRLRPSGPGATVDGELTGAGPIAISRTRGPLATG